MPLSVIVSIALETRMKNTKTLSSNYSTITYDVQSKVCHRKSNSMDAKSILLPSYAAISGVATHTNRHSCTKKICWSYWCQLYQRKL